ncbi:M14 family zinc carboxypeptidase [Micromonospora sp. NPDC050397]|uniref:M14 family metallopeptidase n=1 Tax=Micromonospora sp. NPDC050397 TaxID=3364279 RepID=UPI0038508227
MRKTRLAIAGVFTLVGVMVMTTPVVAAPPAAPSGGQGNLEVYVGSADAKQIDVLRNNGVDVGHAIGEVDQAGRSAVQVVLTREQAAKLAAKGVPLSVKKVRGKEASRALREQTSKGWTAYRSYSEPGGIRDEITSTAARFPKLTKVETIGRSVQGKPILAVKVTKNAKNVEDGKRPAVLYGGNQHAREWITPEMVRRLMHHVLDNYGTDPEITRLVDTTELWFLPVSNPDGYDFTFTPDNRLWRKNLRDNNGDGKITAGDGVDLNRNFSYKWGYDNEGSSPDPSSETYRGSGPNSEPETKALDGLFRRVGFEYYINYHSAAELLLYGVGWQVETPTPDDLIYEALAGDDAHPAIPGYDPDISAELYPTNGDTDTHATVRYGTLGFTPEMSTCETVSDSDPNDEWLAEDCASVFNFPDDEDLIAAEVAKNIPFALAVGKSAASPDNPVSVVGRSTPDFEIDKFDTSYGTRQPVATIARRSLKNVQMHYVVNGGRPKTVEVKEWRGGERYGDTHDDYYAELRGTVTGTKPGDRVEVWFTGTRAKGGGPTASEHFTYQVSTDIGGDVLVLAVEDVTGLSPVQTGTSAKYADEVAAALTAAGKTSDLYDFDTRGRKAPHPLGVLSHYDAVVWETGDDVILREPGQVAGTTAKAAFETELAVRDYLNEGGKVLVSGKNALFAQSVNGSYYYLPGPGPECAAPGGACLPILNDFQQYYLGAHTYVSGGGQDGDGNPYPLDGRSGSPFEGFNGILNAPGSAQNQDHTASLLSTSSFLPPDQFPQFTSSVPVGWGRPGAAPFDPRTGSWYVFSGQSDVAYKRLTRTVDLTGATSGQLRFYVSHDTEADWDFTFVEAHEVGTDNWTTLPEANGQTNGNTGASCPEGLVDELHPHLAHYIGADCSPTGSTGSWSAASGPSNGWKEWVVDLTAYAGKQVELSISYVSDWSTQGLGVFVDDTKVVRDGVTVAETSFETDLGGWTVAGPPAGSVPASSDWARTQKAFEEGSVVTTPDTVFLGFGLEGLAPPVRNDLVARSVDHLLGAGSTRTRP